MVIYKNMIQPVNGHILIKPLEHKSLLPTEKGTFEEVGIVIRGNVHNPSGQPVVGEKDKVWFDPWLAAKFPTGESDDFFWLVKWDDIRAVEKYEADQISK